MPINEGNMSENKLTEIDIIYPDNVENLTCDRIPSKSDEKQTR